MTAPRHSKTSTAAPPLRGAFLDAMSRTACSVTVVSTDGPAGRAGVTVSAMSSVSADGPTPKLLICVHRSGAACPAILENGVFCVNLLRAEQSGISDVFAGRTDAVGADRFSGLDWTRMVTGAPRLIDPLAAFDCRLSHANLVGTHYVMFGAVEAVFVADSGAPLIYADRAYGTPGSLAQAAA